MSNAASPYIAGAILRNYLREEWTCSSSSLVLVLTIQCVPLHFWCTAVHRNPTMHD